MTTLNDFKQLRASVPAEVQTELYSLFSQDPEASFQRMVDIAAELQCRPDHSLDHRI